MIALDISRAAAGASVVLASLALGGAVAAQTGGDLDQRPTGFLTEATGGMPAASWQGTSLATAKRLTSALSAAPHSRALRDLQFKVMVSALAPPGGEAGPAPSLFARRVERLAAMGEGESLNEMVRSSGGYEDPAIASTVANALMMAGERDAACTVVRNHALAPPLAQRADIACKLMAGDNDGALAQASALRGADAGYAQLVRIAAGAAPPGAAPPALPDGPEMVVLSLAHLPPPAMALQSSQPPVIRSLVWQRALPIVTRLQIAERGEGLAIIEATRLGDLYVQAVREGVQMPPAMAARANLVASVRAASNPQEVMNAVLAVYGEARGSPLFATIARASAVGLLNLPPKPEYANLAQEAMRGFLLLGDWKLTQAWLQVALKAGFNNARALAALDRLVPLVAIAGIDNPHHLPAEQINRWYELMREDDARQAPLRANLLLELFRATGIDVPPGSTDLPEAAPAAVRLFKPPAATLQALRAAGEAHRRAETALLAAIAIGETPLTELHPSTVGQIVRALMDAGETHDARLFAVEAAIAYGL